MALECIGVLSHPQRPDTFPVAEHIAESLRAHGIDAWAYHDWDTRTISEDVSCANMIVAIGGDGAMLKAARECAPYAVPVLGLNMGRLGFLTEIAGPDEWDSNLQRVVKGEYWIEKRMMIQAQVVQGDEIILHGHALNDVVVSSNGVGRMVQLETYIDRHWATTYSADALIIATPTGSTAYALALGGPIMPPELLNLLLVPAAPHLSMDRPIILSEGAQVGVRASRDNRNVLVLTVDGVILGNVPDGATVHITASQYSGRFVRMRDRNYFYRSLLDRMEPRVNLSRPLSDTLSENDQPAEE